MAPSTHFFRPLIPFSSFILLSGKPEAVQNCSVVNESTDSFTVNCAPGFNGGLPQQFRLGVYLVKPSDGARVLVANLTAAAPRFGWDSPLQFCSRVPQQH